MWLHMGAYGPKRIDAPSDAAHPGSPPFNILDAPETVLDVSDVVFVDPVGTGFSRALGTHENKEFWGLKEDARSLAEFIQTWTTEQGRWNSPRFLLGESYGTTHAALIAELLQDDFQMGVNGIILVSQALDYAGSSPYVDDNLISYVTFLPTMAATALHHDKVKPVPASREQFLADARLFASDELLPALFRGNTLSRTLRLNPGLKVLVASGYYDVVTPFFDAEYTLNRHGIRSEQLVYKFYDGGHMMYVKVRSWGQVSHCPFL